MATVDLKNLEKGLKKRKLIYVSENDMPRSEIDDMESEAKPHV
jgi:hypothetical protein